MAKVFISYRREDTLPIAGRVEDRLQTAYGRGSVYRDISVIPPGVDFRQHIGEAVSRCDALIVLIGSRWLEASRDGARRLDNPADFVRLEIEAALARGIPVIPALVDGAAMPLEKDLPPSLSELAYRNAVKLDSGVDFHNHMDRLVRGLDLLGSENSDSANVQFDDKIRPVEEPSVRQAEENSTGPHAAADVVPETLHPLSSKTSGPPLFHATPLSLKRGIALTVVLLFLNSVLAALGSVLWEHFPYWPGFMVFALVCAYYPVWGVWVAILSPIAAAFLLTGGSTVHVYVLVNLLQALLVIGAFHQFQIDPRLPSWRDRLRYLGLAVTVPSFVGACTAWLLRRFTAPEAGDPALFTYALWWTLENLLPAIFPGIWLHRVVGESYRPFSWGIDGRSRSWITRTFEYAAPWMMTLLIAGCLVIVMVTDQIGTVRVRPAVWIRVHELAAESVVFLGMVLAMCISLLVSMGYAIRNAKQSWLLEEAVRRHLPTQQEAERILSGKAAPSTRRLLTIVCISIRAFDKVLTHFGTTDLVTWLNSYFDCVYSSCCAHNGCTDRYTGQEMLLLFGLKGGDSHALEALRCALDLFENVGLLSREYQDKHLPPISVRMGIHTGLAITGEIGSRDQRHYMVVGESVSVALDIERKTEDLSSDFIPMLISHDTVQEAGVLLDTRFRRGFRQIAVGNPETDQGRPLYAIVDTGSVNPMLRRAAVCEVAGS